VQATNHAPCKRVVPRNLDCREDRRARSPGGALRRARRMRIGSSGTSHGMYCGGEPPFLGLFFIFFRRLPGARPDKEAGSRADPGAGGGATATRFCCDCHVRLLSHEATLGPLDASLHARVRERTGKRNFFHSRAPRPKAHAVSLVPTLPWKGRVACGSQAQPGSGGGGGSCCVSVFTPPRRFAPTLPFQGRVNRRHCIGSRERLAGVRPQARQQSQP
jgi:hypothetical protein